MNSMAEKMIIANSHSIQPTRPCRALPGLYREGWTKPVPNQSFSSYDANIDTVHLHVNLHNTQLRK